jgi:hypothetical protein
MISPVAGSVVIEYPRSSVFASRRRRSRRTGNFDAGPQLTTGQFGKSPARPRELFRSRPGGGGCSRSTSAQGFPLRVSAGSGADGPVSRRSTRRCQPSLTRRACARSMRFRGIDPPPRGQALMGCNSDTTDPESTAGAKAPEDYPPRHWVAARVGDKVGDRKIRPTARRPAGQTRRWPATTSSLKAQRS